MTGTLGTRSRPPPRPIPTVEAQAPADSGARRQLHDDVRIRPGRQTGSSRPDARGNEEWSLTPPSCLVQAPKPPAI